MRRSRILVAAVLLLGASCTGLTAGGEEEETTAEAVPGLERPEKDERTQRERDLETLGREPSGDQE